MEVLTGFGSEVSGHVAKDENPLVPDVESRVVVDGSLGLACRRNDSVARVDHRGGFGGALSGEREGAPILIDLECGDFVGFLDFFGGRGGNDCFALLGAGVPNVQSVALA